MAEWEIQGVASGQNTGFTRQFGAVALLGIGYAVLAVVCSKLFYSGSDAAGLWLANAFAAGFILRAGLSSLTLPVVIVLATSVAGNLALGHALEDVVLFSVTNTISVLLAVLLLRGRFSDLEEVTASPGNYATALLLAGAAAPAIAGLLYAQASFHLNGEPLLLTWWLWLSGDALGYAIILPIAFSATRDALADFTRQKAVVQFLLSLSFVAFAAASGLTWTTFPIMVLFVPLMVSAAFLPAFMLAIVAAFAAVSVLTALAFGLAPSAPIVEALAAYRFQVSLAICATLPMLGQMVIQQMRNDRRRAFDSEQRFRRAMKDSAIGVAIVALDGKIVETNDAFAEMLGYTTGELETKTFFEITYPEDRAIGAETMRAVRAGEADSYRFEKRYVRKDGRPVWAQLAGSVIRDAQSGKPIYLVSQIEDIDARKKSEAALAESEMRWNFALAAAGQGVWDLDVRKGEVRYSSTWKRMLGYEEHELDGDPDHWLTLIHPDDRERVDRADKDHLDGKAPMFEAEFRMQHKEGHWLWILDRGQIIERDSDGRMLRAIGTLTDITMRREAEERLVSYASLLADEKERLRVTLNAIGDAVICTDADNRITFMNPVAEKLTHIAESKALGRSLADIYRSVDEETGERLPVAAQSDRNNNRAVLVRADGSRCSIREVVSSIETEKGEFGGSVIVFQDFTDARTLQRELAYAAAHDPLTGLANRSSFIQKMEALVASAGGEAADSHFLFIDLDRFKAVNDTGGHAAGDALLKRVADAISTLARPGDLVARLGGDEFAAVLKNCSVREAEAIANRIVGAVGTLDFTWDGRRFEIGASIGVASLGQESEIDEIIARADEACYSAKGSGRNCVVVFDAKSASRRSPVRKFSVAS
ncbi:MAG TPA: PAS domain S-box protein [Rhizobiaceae bacterium]|nr:PAS domain S-box protein [Rhizobiaceae bacterium]